MLDKSELSKWLCLAAECTGSEITESKIAAYLMALGDYTNKQIEYAVKMHIRDERKGKWFPTVADIRFQLVPKFDEMYLRMINKQPKNDLESRVFSACRYDCVRMDEKRAIERLKVEYQKQEKMPPPNAQAARIEHKRPKSPVELMIEQNAKKYEGKDRESIIAEIDSMKASGEKGFKKIEQPKKPWTICLQCEKVGKCIRAKKCLDGRK